MMKIRNCAKVAIHAEYGDDGQVLKRSYEWIGSTRLPFEVSKELLEVCITEKIVPWPILRIGTDDDGLTIFYARVDGINLLSAIYWWIRFRVGKLVERWNYKQNPHPSPSPTVGGNK